MLHNKRLWLGEHLKLMLGVTTAKRVLSVGYERRSSHGQSRVIGLFLSCGADSFIPTASAMKLFHHTPREEGGHRFSDGLKVSSTTLRKELNCTGTKPQNLQLQTAADLHER